ncbi:MAG TPA: stage II sporulation protein P [Firmicutes bacterium]|nr:stage II sporulation protein P [Bacillota bacterium]
MKHYYEQSPFYRKGGYWFFLAGCLLLVTLLLGLVIAILDFSRDEPWSGPPHPLSLIKRRFHLDFRLGRGFMEQVIPGLKAKNLEEDTDLFLEVNGVDLFLRFMVDIRYQSPQELLRVQIPLLSTLQTKRSYLTPVARSREILPPGQVEREARRPPKTSPQQERNLPDHSGLETKGEEPRVLIYHTHTSESYIPVSGQGHIFNGKGDIVLVGKYLSELLNERYGVRTLHTEEIHDYYPFRESYQRSEKTIKDYLLRHPHLDVLIDLHRDATPGIEHRVKIKGKDAARLIFVVGNGKIGLSHPDWKKNHQFAQELVEAVDRYYPGLAHGIILSEARYNQHLHERAIIIEVGDHHSTLEEAYYSVELLAEVLAAYLHSSFQSYSL